jgi:uncharacterized repeat protein (TIGR01451 family)
MKSKIILFFILIAISFVSKSQTYVAIPDPNFATYLTLRFPTCMKGDSMDIDCAGIQSAISMTVNEKYISDLKGIEHFTNLQTLNCKTNLLTSLPALPNSLLTLCCDNNQLKSLPTLPNSLEKLECSNNQLTEIPLLPNALNRLLCQGNQLVSLPNLPSSIQTLFCSNNLLTSLPTLPYLLQTLNCDNNQLTSLPALPKLLEVLNFTDNQVKSIPALPIHLQYLKCSRNKLTGLPALPNSLIGLTCGFNLISCFPTLPSSIIETCFNISGNPFTCLPNYIPCMTPRLLLYPLCVDGDKINNPKGCTCTKGIVGTTYLDQNNNCKLDSTDATFANAHLLLYDDEKNLLSQTYTYSDGIYNFPDSSGIYHLQLDTADVPFTVKCASSGIEPVITLSDTNQLVSNVNFNIVCKPGFDVGIQAAYHTGWVFPGMIHRLNIVAGDMSNWYNLHCAAGIKGEVHITVNGPVIYYDKAPGALQPLIKDHVFIYNISDYGYIDTQNNFGLLFTTDTTAKEGDTISVKVTITPETGDNNTNNNTYEFSYFVENSFDPNNKEVYPVNVPPGYQDWLTYTIHFQNTGNAPAMNIRLTDTLDDQLDLSTFQVINYSFRNAVSLKNNGLTFRFQNIMLADSASDPEGSKGFVQYRIKPKANLPLGTKIKNTANIYFDYNAAIVTNTTVNEFVQSLTVKENKLNTTLSVSPNPSNGKYYINLTGERTTEELTIEVVNLLGELVLKTKTQNTIIPIDLSDQPNGIFILKINNGNLFWNQKVIKE